jgi:hypothetical protein
MPAALRTLWTGCAGQIPEVSRPDRQALVGLYRDSRIHYGE